MRKPIIIANWKMYKTRAEAKAFCAELLPLLAPDSAVEAAICAPFTQLDVLAEALLGSTVGVGAQNFYPAMEGAFTGEVSLEMLQELGVGYVLVGHSERRMIFGESDILVREKLEAAYEAGYQPVLCVGETLAEREAGQSLAVAIGQLSHAMAHLSEAQIGRLIVAYEPIWAIGTGMTATAQDAEAVIGQLREYVRQTYGAAVAETLRIQYGGSVKGDNIAQLMAQPNIDGALVGGASLQAASFAQLINSQERAYE